jgi:hypothetical protein
VNIVTRWLGRVLMLVATLLLWPSSAFAQKDGSKRIAVHVEGAQASQFREVVLEAVPDGIEVVDEKEFSIGLRQVGLPGNMGYAVTSPTQRRQLLRVIRKVIKRQELAGVVVGRVRSGNKGLEMVTLYVDETETLPVDENVSLKGDRAAQVASIEAALGAVFAELAPPEPEPEPEPEPVADEPQADEDDEDDEEEDDEPSDFDPGRVGSELFSIGLGAEFGGRFFAYNEPCSGADNPCAGQYRELRPYDVFGVPGLVIDGEIYPAATTGIAVLSDLGLVLQYAHFFGLSSQVESQDENTPGPTFGTSWNRFAAGLRYRLRIGEPDDNPIVIRPDVRFGFLNFTFEPDDAAAEALVDQIGSVEYLFIRGGIDARLPLGEVFALVPSFGLLGPLSSGDAYDRVSGASVLAIDAGLTFAFVLGLGIEARAGIEYTRYFASFEPDPNDPAVAGGATDQFLGLRVGAAYVF